ncbi:MAG TPA: efflux RND transporter periplasmic adaptor subunit [Clostridia bacterium]|nr:efflux RND transporter periplasmic adaptor subunit [Clostridia bacterium]
MKKIALVFLAIALLVSTAACGEAAQAAPIAAAAEQKQTVEAFGTVEAASIKNITLEFEAPVTRVYVKEGEHTGSGQRLVSLDMTGLTSTIETKKLSLAAARNDVGRISFGTDLKKLSNDKQNAARVYEKSSKELETKKQLYASGSIALNELENFRKQVDSDKKNLDDITYAIENATNSKGSANDQKTLESSLLESELKVLENKLAKPYINDSDIVSDVSNGIVYDIGYLQGDIAGPQKKLLSILDLDTLQVSANIPEEFFKDVKVGSAATIVPVADKSKKYGGKITFISGKTTNSNGETQIPVRISIDKPDEFLLPGFNVDVSIDIANH